MTWVPLGLGLVTHGELCLTFIAPAEASFLLGLGSVGAQVLSRNCQWDCRHSVCELPTKCEFFLYVGMRSCRWRG